MIGNPKWFKTRKYTGWGLTPNTWQGWAYIIAFIIPIAIIQSITQLSAQTKSGITLIWIVVLLIDVIDIMIKLKKDEREILHEAIAERNASWYIVLSLIIGSLIKFTIDGFQGQAIDPVVLVAIFGGFLVKAITYFYLRNK